MSELLLRVAVFFLAISAAIASYKLVFVAWEWTP